jgi:hypothetical protein
MSQNSNANSDKFGKVAGYLVIFFHTLLLPNLVGFSLPTLSCRQIVDKPGKEQQDISLVRARVSTCKQMRGVGKISQVQIGHDVITSIRSAHSGISPPPCPAMLVSFLKNHFGQLVYHFFDLPRIQDFHQIQRPLVYSVAQELHPWPFSPVVMTRPSDSESELRSKTWKFEVASFVLLRPPPCVCALPGPVYVRVLDFQKISVLV